MLSAPPIDVIKVVRIAAIEVQKLSEAVDRAFGKVPKRSTRKETKSGDAAESMIG